MLANFGLKIRPFWDSDHENWYSYFSRKFLMIKGFYQITYLPKSHLRAKNEGNRFFNSCHSMADIPWPSLLINCLFFSAQRRSYSSDKSGYEKMMTTKVRSLPFWDFFFFFFFFQRTNQRSKLWLALRNEAKEIKVSLNCNAIPFCFFNLSHKAKIRIADFENEPSKICSP